MGFMQRYVYEGKGYIVESMHGSEFVPQDACGDLEIVEWFSDEHDIKHVESLDDYLECRIADIESVTLFDGFYGRYSASGYLDRTGWHWNAKEADLIRELDEAYGDDSEDADVDNA